VQPAAGAGGGQRAAAQYLSVEVGVKDSSTSAVESDYTADFEDIHEQVSSWMCDQSPATALCVWWWLLLAVGAGVYLWVSKSNGAID